MIQYVIQAKIDSLIAAGVCAYLGLKENLVTANYQDSDAIYIVAIYGITGLVVMETLKWMKGKIIH